MATVVITGPTPSFENPPKWYMWELDYTDIAADEDPATAICTIPAGIKVLDARLAVTRAETVSTTPTGGVLIGDEPVVSTSTALGTETVASATAAELVDAIQDGASASQILYFASARSGSAPTVKPKVIVAILAGRLVM